MDAYHFGIELEFLMREKDQKNKVENVSQLQAYMQRKWERGIKHEVFGDLTDGIQPLDEKQRRYAWTLVDDTSITNQPDGVQRWPMEIVSPIFLYKDDDIPPTRIEKVLKFFNEHVDMTTNKSCGFHIHVSKENGWTLADLKRIASAVIKFSDTLDALFDNKDQTAGSQTKSNRWTLIYERKLSLAEVIQSIDNCKSIDELIEFVNSAETPDKSRYYSWNFTNTASHAGYTGKGREPLGTVEFRSPRTVTNVNVILKWIVFTVTFIHASLTSDVGQVDSNKLDDFLSGTLPPHSSVNLCWKRYKSAGL